MALIGASLDLGAGRRGVDMGPSAIRYAGLAARIESLGRRVFDWGNVEGAVPEATEMGSERVRFLAPIKQACERVAHLVARSVEEGLQPLVLGGDHSIAIGTLGTASLDERSTTVNCCGDATTFARVKPMYPVPCGLRITSGV